MEILFSSPPAALSTTPCSVPTIASPNNALAPSLQPENDNEETEALDLIIFLVPTTMLALGFVYCCYIVARATWLKKKQRAISSPSTNDPDQLSSYLVVKAKRSTEAVFPEEDDSRKPVDWSTLMLNPTFSGPSSVSTLSGTDTITDVDPSTVNIEQQTEDKQSQKISSISSLARKPTAGVALKPMSPFKPTFESSSSEEKVIKTSVTMRFYY